MKKSESGNAIIVIIVAIFLFGALAAVFMRGTQSGQGKMTEYQAKMSAQELANFFKTVDNAVQKLRSKGCSDGDISFSNSKDTGSFVTANSPSTAPVDKSCHIFDPAGGGLSFNMDWMRYQVSASELSSNQTQIGNMYFRADTVAVQGMGSAATEYLMSLNFVKPEICDAYDSILGLTIDKVAIEPTESPIIYGDNNTSLANKVTFCHYKQPLIQNGGAHTQIIYVWGPR